MTVGDILLKYLGSLYEQLRPKMVVRDIKETGLTSRGQLNQAGLKDCWVVFMPNESSQCILAPSRVICIHKKTGAILFDGSEAGQQEKDRRQCPR